MTIAVITRTKNRPLMLPRAANSIRGQRINDLLWVVVNDGGEKNPVDQAVSDFNDVSSAKAFAIHNEASAGMEAASNIGIKASNSEYIAIHDDDDTWHPDFLSSCLDFLAANKAYQGVVTLSTSIQEEIRGNEILTVNEKPFNSRLKTIDLAHIAIRNQFPPISFVFSRRAFNDLGGFNESMSVLGDWDFNLRFLSKFDIGLIPEQLAFLHTRSNSLESENAYSNTVVTGAKKHLDIESLYRHARYREDIKNGEVGLGHLLMTGKQFQLVQNELDKLKFLGDGWRKIQRIARKFRLS